MSPSGPYRVVKRPHHSHFYGARGTLTYTTAERYRVQFVNPDGVCPKTELLQQRFASYAAALAVAEKENLRWKAVQA